MTPPPPAALTHVRKILIDIFGEADTHFTARKSGSAIPCVVYALTGETVMPMISDPHHLISIDVQVDVQAKTAKAALDLAGRVRQALEGARRQARRISFDVDEVEADARNQRPTAAKRTVVASSTYTVYE